MPRNTVEHAITLLEQLIQTAEYQPLVDEALHKLKLGNYDFQGFRDAHILGFAMGYLLAKGCVTIGQLDDVEQLAFKSTLL